MSDSFDYAANFYSDWFSWKLKRKRLSFLGAVFFGNIFVYGMMFLSDRLFAQWAVMFIICFALLWWVAYMSIASQRLRDMAVSQWWLAAFFAVQASYLVFPYGSVFSFLAVCLLAIWPSKSNDAIEVRDQVISSKSN